MGVQRFPEGGALDRIDKLASSPVLHATLPWFLECALSVPAAWFGCPVYAILVVPILLGTVGLQERAFYASCIALPTALIGGGCWAKLCFDNMAIGEGPRRAYSVFGKPLLIALPQVAMAVLSYAGGPGAAQVAAVYLTSWHLTQALLEALKGLTWRLRPTACMREELGKVPRCITDLTAIVRLDSQANLSFPSGDAAGGAIFATAASLASPPCLVPVAAVALLCALGRVYFHCHHLLDVAVGQAVGVGVTLLLNRCIQASWMSMILSQLCLVGLWPLIQKAKPHGAVKQALSSDGLKIDQGAQK